MADSGSCELLSGLYMAPKSRYRKYGARNCNAHTRNIRVSVPYISHLAKHGPPNLPYISEIARNNVPFVPDTTPTAAPQHPTILFPICSPARRPASHRILHPHTASAAPHFLQNWTESGELDRIWRFLSENGEEGRPVPPESDKISPILSEKREAEEEHRSTPPRLPRNQTETEDLLSENEEEEEEDARPPRNRTETGGFCLKTGKERPCQP